MGPFLLPSATSGGAEIPPVTAANPNPDPDNANFPGGRTAYPGTGKSYISDPAREGPVTGSPTGNNFVRIQGPPGSNIGGSGLADITATNFTLVGRIFTGAVPSQVTVDRASYARPVATSPTGNKVDVFATAFPATQGRIPGSLPPAVITPQLQYYDAPCVVDPVTGVQSPPPITPTQMLAPAQPTGARARQ